MAKLCILVATFVLLFASAAAIDFRFPFTTSTIIREQETKCQKQIQKQQQLIACQRYLLESSKMSSGPSLMSVNQRSSWREEFPQCCDQLENVKENCRCDAITRVLQQLREQSEEQVMRDVNIEEMLQNAQSLPNLCRLKPPYCHVPSESYLRM